MLHSIYSAFGIAFYTHCYIDSPFVLQAIMFFTWIDFKPSTYGDYKYPAWADAMGWMMTMTSVLAIPIVMLIQIFRADKEETLWLVCCVYCVYIRIHDYYNLHVESITLPIRLGLFRVKGGQVETILILGVIQRSVLQK